jgi:hypothetical protein
MAWLFSRTHYTQRMNICLGLLAATRIGVIHGFA